MNRCKNIYNTQSKDNETSALTFTNMENVIVFVKKDKLCLSVL